MHILRPATVSVLLAMTLAPAGCGSDDTASGVDPSSDSELDPPGSDEEVADGDGTVEDVDAADAPDGQPPNPINELLGGLVSVFGENIETDVVHTIEGGTYDVITRWIEEEPIFNLTMPVEPTEVGEPMPVVVWNNGGCLRSDFLWQKTMFDVWAADGFAVLALTSLTGPADNFGMLGMATEVEHMALIDWVETQNESGPYEGLFDLDRVVIAGNSCGGMTALRSASQDDRVAAVFALSGALGGDAEVVSKITVPVGYAVGGDEDFLAAGAASDLEALPEGVPAMIAHRFEGDHLVVSSDMTITPDVGKIGLSFMRLALDGSQEAYDALMSDRVCAGCQEGHWTLQSKHLDMLVK